MTPIIEAQGLTKSFGKVRALDGLDLVAESGQVTALLGPNGAGKTTFVSAVATLLRPDGGEIHVAGLDVCAQPKRVRQIIGLAGQFASVEPAMTGTENLRLVARLFGLGRREARAAADVLERLGLADAGDRSSATTRAACAAVSTWAPAWSVGPSCCCSTSPPPGSTPRPHRPVGRDPRPGGRWHRRPAHHPVPRGSRPAGAPRRDHRPRRVIAAGTPDELKDRAGTNVIEVRPRPPATSPPSKRRSGGSAAKRRTPTWTPNASLPASRAAPISSATSCACSTNSVSRSTMSGSVVPASTRCSSPSPDDRSSPLIPRATPSPSRRTPADPWSSHDDCH